MTVHACAYCGKPRPPEQMVYSRWTKARYCAIEQKQCETRGAKRRKKLVSA